MIRPDDKVAPQIGILTASPDRLLLDLLKISSVDFILLDAEHTLLGPKECAEVASRFANSSTRVLVRVPNLDPDVLLTYANTGIHEVVLPRIQSVEAVEQAWRVLQYPPIGARPRQFTPASDYGSHWDRILSVSILVETVSAVKYLEALAELEFVDCCWIGPQDLGDDYARLYPDKSIDVAELVTDCIERLVAKPCLLGLAAKDELGITEAIDRGADRCALYWEVYLLNRLRAISAVS